MESVVQKLLLLVACIVQSFFLITDCFENAADEKTFVDSLLDITTKNGPHSNMVNKTVFVYMDLYKLTDINEKEGKITMRMWVYIAYYIPELAWDPVAKGVYGVVLPAGTVWTPDIVAYDANELIYQDFKQQFILFDGLVAPSSSTLTFEVNCIIKIKYFPFDQQDCTVSIGQWAFTNTVYRVGVDPAFSQSDRLDLANFQQSGQWELLEPVLFKIKERKVLDDVPDFFTYDMIEYYFKVRRHPTFYVIVIIVPSIILGVLSILVFVLPVESGEKISLGITILLSQIVELLVLSDVLPPASGDDFPIVGYLVTFLIILISIAVLVSIFVTSIYHTPPCRCLPAWIGKIMDSRLMDFLHAQKLGMKEEIARYLELSEKVEENSKDLERDGRKNDDKNSFQNSKVAPAPWTVLRDRLGGSEREKEPQQLLKGVDYAKDAADLAELKREINTRAWKLFSVFIDRITFCLYTTTLTGGSLYFFLEAVLGD